MERFLLKIQVTKVYQEEKDQMVWTTSKNGRFSVKSLYFASMMGDKVSFPQAMIWKFSMPPRVAFFAWEAT